MKDRGEIIAGLVALLVVLGVVVALLIGWRRCSEADGVYVRGLVWYSCIEQGKHP